MPVGDGERLIRLALLPHSLGPVVHGDVAPIVFTLLESLPILLGFVFPNGDDLP